MKDFASPNCPECDGLDRREFVRNLAIGGAAIATGLPFIAPRVLKAGELGPMPRVVNTVAEEMVKELYAGLDAEQKKAVVKPWDHPARKSVNPNKALDKKIGTVYTKPQQELIERIVRAITATDDKAWHQITRAGTWDASKSFDQTGADIFGDPSKGKFAFQFTGHHLTMRCDGDNEEGAAFGGPIYYGHTPNGYHPTNVFAYQTQQVMKLFDALDPKQQKKSMAKLGDPKVQEGKGSLERLAKEERPGILYADLTGDQKELVEQVMKAVLSPFRQQDGAEVVTIIKQMGGMEKVHLAFYDEEYESSKTSEKQPWSFWRLLGPGFVWNFRVLPHVHTYVNIASKIG
ncbi:MAG TPA: DUF3500 domain-containing protein [Gemmataceae bacterium]|nr:DUF3500 domain-containing protein [Gemmataceae bacterium]